MRLECNINNTAHNFEINNIGDKVGIGIEQRQPTDIRRPDSTSAMKKQQDSLEPIIYNVGVEHLESLTEEYGDIFSKNPSITAVYLHRVRISEPEEFLRRVYPIPMQYTGEVKSEIERMLDNGIIQRSTSNFLNPLVVVKNKSGVIRICLDMRNLNSLVDKEFDCVPIKDEM